MRYPSTTYYILNNPAVDVNIIDDKGNNLLHTLLSSIELNEYSVNEIKYMIEQKKCDTNVINNDGLSILHTLINFQLPILVRKTKKHINEEKISKIDLLKIRE